MSTKSRRSRPRKPRLIGLGVGAAAGAALGAAGGDSNGFFISRGNLPQVLLYLVLELEPWPVF